MTEILLARHGETVWHAENRYAGSSDVDLTERGAAQAEALSRWAASRSIGAVYASDLRRSILTAAPAAAALGLELLVDPRLREVHFGRGEGLTRAEIQAAFPGALTAFHAHPARSPLPDGERGVDAIARAWTALTQHAADNAGGRVLVVMHSSLMRLVLCHALDIDPDRYRTVFPSVRNAAITTITIGEGATALHGYNIPTD